ncbi:MAG: hypothetical protein IJ829_03980, partial [Kiritimatiellae bacterium]|nr:hypothetical protein [Kiritimatiellia bacterium]
MARKINVSRENVNGEGVIRVAFRNWSAAGCFLMLWLAMWTFGCTMIARQLVEKGFPLADILFALPFFAAEVVVGGILLLMVFGQTRFTFTRLGGTRFGGIGSIGRTKEFSFPERGEITTDEIISHGRRGGTMSTYRLVVKTPFDLDGPRVIYSSSDWALVKELCALAREASGLSGAAANPSGDAPAA